MRFCLILFLLVLPCLVQAQNVQPGVSSTHEAHSMHADQPAQSDMKHADTAVSSQEHSGHMEMGQSPNATAAPHVHLDAPPDQVPGVEEKLGQIVALDTAFRDENGKQVTLAGMITKPTIIVPIYFNCPNVCAIIQSNLTGVLLDVKLEPGQDFQIVSISFDETDTPEHAMKEKRNYMAAMNYKFPEDAWHFLTGDVHNIHRFLDSIGFTFKKQGKDFIHPVVVVAVTPKGMVSRYLYGVTPLAFDLTMAATEAAKEQTGLSIKRVLAYCFAYDPQGKRYVFNFMKITGTGVLTMLAILLVSLLIAGPKKRGSRNNSTPRG